MSENRCRIVWICEVYTCYLYGSFSVFRLQHVYAFFVNPCHSWIKIAASPNTVWIPVWYPAGDPWRRVGPGMALTTIGEVSQWGGVAVRSGCRTGLVSKFNFRSPVWQILTIFSTCFIYEILNTHTKFEVSKSKKSQENGQDRVQNLSVCKIWEVNFI